MQTDATTPNNVGSGCLHGALDKSNQWLVPSLPYLDRTRVRRERDGWWEGGKQAPLALPLSAPLSLILLADWETTGDESEATTL